jgi:hypothetical protein
MIPDAGSSLPLTVPLTVQPSPDKDGAPAYTSTAFNLATAFHREFSCCVSDSQRRKVCQKYRDRILSISQFADVTAAAFNDAFPQFLRESSRGDDARAWTSFASLVKRQQKSHNRAAQLLRLQTSIVAIWGKDVFTHYGWGRLPLDSTKLLHSVASTLRDWKVAVEVINETILARHERRVVKHDNRARQIGEHSRGSKIQDRHSPVEPRDLEIILSRIKDGKLQTSPQVQRKKPIYTINGTPIREYGLAPDQFSMIVPGSTSGLEPKSPSPSRQANKRRRLERNDHEGLARTEDSQMPESCHQTLFMPTYISDSEMTELEEESSGGSMSAGISTDLQAPMDQSELRSHINNAKSTSPGESGRETPNSSTPFQLQCACASHDVMADTAISPLLQDDMSAEMQTENHEGGAYMSVADCESTPVQGSDKPSNQTSGPRSEDETFDTEYQNEDWQEDSPSLDKGFDQFPIQFIVDRACETISDGDNCYPRLLHEHGLPALQSNDVVVPESRSESMAVDSEALNFSTTDCMLFPASTEGRKEKYCTDTNVEDDGTIIGRMGSRHAKRLREILNTAQKHDYDRGKQEDNEFKVKWLEQTRWASLYASPVDLSPICQLPTDVDVSYMDWKTFQRRAECGEVFRHPIVVKQTFKDSGMYELHSYMALLYERFPNLKLDVHNSGTGERVGQSITDLSATRATSEATDTDELIASDDVINLRKISNADAPLFTRMKRFRLLETLVDRVSNLAPGKRTCHEANSILDCLGFDLLSSSGAFSRPQVHVLLGSWVRCLSGSTAWIFAPSMSDTDWDDFAQDGARWFPGTKGRMIVLEKDDVLLIPPGVRVLHTVFTLETSLIAGGMLWDEYDIPNLLDELLWIGRNQVCTNDTIAYILPKIIHSLEIWIQENGARLPAVRNNAEYIASVQQGIRRLRSLG